MTIHYSPAGWKKTRMKRFDKGN